MYTGSILSSSSSFSPHRSERKGVVVKSNFACKIYASCNIWMAVMCCLIFNSFKIKQKCVTISPKAFCLSHTSRIRYESFHSREEIIVKKDHQRQRWEKLTEKYSNKRKPSAFKAKKEARVESEKKKSISMTHRRVTWQYLAKTRNIISQV